MRKRSNTLFPTRANPKIEALRPARVESVIVFLSFSVFFPSLEREERERKQMENERLPGFFIRRKKSKMKKEKTIVSVLKDISTRLFISFYIFFNPGSWKPWEFSCNRLMVSPTDAKKEKSIKGCRHQPFLFLINSVCGLKARPY